MRDLPHPRHLGTVPPSDVRKDLVVNQRGKTEAGPILIEQCVGEALCGDRIGDPILVSPASSRPSSWWFPSDLDRKEQHHVRARIIGGDDLDPLGPGSIRQLAPLRASDRRSAPRWSRPTLPSGRVVITEAPSTRE